MGGIDTASAKVASARYRPSSRSAGRPKRKPASRHTAPAIGIVAQYGIPARSISIAAVYAPIA